MNESDTAAKIFLLATEAEAGIAAAVEAVHAGHCIVVPTDTVYGIGADAFSAAAVKGLLEAKRRGADMPPPVLIAERSMLRALASDVPADATALAKAFWPGALTMILKAQRSLRLELGETNGTVAIRVPAHDGLRELLRHTGPLAVSSANISGEPAANDCGEAVTMLGDSVAVYLDGGRTSGQGASTIVDFTATDGGRVVRQGAVSFADLAAVVPSLQPVAVVEETPVDEIAEAALAPAIAAPDAEDGPTSGAESPEAPALGAPDSSDDEATIKLEPGAEPTS